MSGISADTRSSRFLDRWPVSPPYVPPVACQHTGTRLDRDDARGTGPSRSSRPRPCRAKGVPQGEQRRRRECTSVSRSVVHFPCCVCCSAFSSSSPSLYPICTCLSTRRHETQSSPGEVRPRARQRVKLCPETPASPLRTAASIAHSNATNTHKRRSRSNRSSPVSLHTTTRTSRCRCRRSPEIQVRCRIPRRSLSVLSSNESTKPWWSRQALSSSSSIST